MANKNKWVMVSILIIIVLILFIFSLIFKTYFLDFDYDTYANQKITHLKIIYKDNVAQNFEESIVHDDKKIESVFRYLNSIALYRVYGDETKYIKRDIKSYLRVEIYNDDYNIGWICIYDKFILRSADLKLFRAKNENIDINATLIEYIK